MPVVENNTVDHLSNKYVALIAGRILRDPPVCSRPTYVSGTIITTGTPLCLTTETDPETLCNESKIIEDIEYELQGGPLLGGLSGSFYSGEQVAAFGMPYLVPNLELQTSIEKSDPHILDYFNIYYSKENLEYDVNLRLIPPPMQLKQFKIKFNFLGKFPPRIRFNPERE
jgi:hypothetical protein